MPSDEEENVQHKLSTLLALNEQALGRRARPTFTMPRPKLLPPPMSWQQSDQPGLRCTCNIYNRRRN